MKLFLFLALIGFATGCNDTEKTYDGGKYSQCQTQCAKVGVGTFDFNYEKNQCTCSAP